MAVAAAVAVVVVVTEAEAEAEVAAEEEVVVVAAEGKFAPPRFLMVANTEQWGLNPNQNFTAVFGMQWRRISTWGFRHFLLGCDGVFFWGYWGSGSNAGFQYSYISFGLHLSLLFAV